MLLADMLLIFSKTLKVIFQFPSMENKHKAEPSSSRSTISPSDFTTDSSAWSLAAADVYFFSGDRESGAILSDSGWNLESEQPRLIGDAANGEFRRGGSGGGGFWFPDHSAAVGQTEQADTANASAAACDASTSNNQSASSSSSEDPAEKSAVSEEKPAEIL